MSRTARLLLGLTGVISGCAFLCLPFVGQNHSLSALGASAVCGGVCFLITIAAVGGRIGRVAARLLGAMVFLLYSVYFVYECRVPQPPLSTWRPSQTSALSAFLGLLLFGFPGAYLAINGRFGLKWSNPPTSDEGLDEQIDLDRDIEE